MPRPCWLPTRRSVSIETLRGCGTGFQPVAAEPTGWKPVPPLSTRREMLQRMAGGFGMVGLAGLLGPGSAFASGTTGASPAPHFAPRAKRIIFLFLNGGPSHVDTFDPKPALAKYEGQQPPNK